MNRISKAFLFLAAVGLVAACDKETLPNVSDEFGLTLVGHAKSKLTLEVPPNLDLDFDPETFAWDTNGDRKVDEIADDTTTVTVKYDTAGTYTANVEIRGEGQSAWHKVTVTVEDALPSFVTRTPFILDFSETWCGPCGSMQNGYDYLKTQGTYDLSKVAFVEVHSTGTQSGWDDWDTAESRAYAQEYEVPGYPTLISDGTSSPWVNGASDAQTAANWQALFEESANSMALASINATVTGDLSEFTVQATVTPVSGIALKDFNIRAYLMEDEIPFATGTRSATNYQHIMRDMDFASLTQGETGESRTAWFTFNPVLARISNMANVGLVIVAERKNLVDVPYDLGGTTKAREVIQAFNCHLGATLTCE